MKENYSSVTLDISGDGHIYADYKGAFTDKIGTNSINIDLSTLADDTILVKQRTNLQGKISYTMKLTLTPKN